MLAGIHSGTWGSWASAWSLKLANCALCVKMLVAEIRYFNQPDNTPVGLLLTLTPIISHFSIIFVLLMCSCSSHYWGALNYIYLSSFEKCQNQDPLLDEILTLVILVQFRFWSAQTTRSRKLRPRSTRCWSSGRSWRTCQIRLVSETNLLFWPSDTKLKSLKIVSGPKFSDGFETIEL